LGKSITAGNWATVSGDRVEAIAPTGALIKAPVLDDNLKLISLVSYADLENSLSCMIITFRVFLCIDNGFP